MIKKVSHSESTFFAKARFISWIFISSSLNVSITCIFFYLVDSVFFEISPRLHWNRYFLIDFLKYLVLISYLSILFFICIYLYYCLYIIIWKCFFKNVEPFFRLINESRALAQNYWLVFHLKSTYPIPFTDSLWYVACLY